MTKFENCCAVSAPRQPGSLFATLDDLERAASRLPATADYAVQTANRYLGPEQSLVGCETRPKEPDEPNVVRRLVALTRRIDDAVSIIDHQLSRMGE